MPFVLMLLLAADSPLPLELDAKAVQTVSYGVVHKLHHVQGVTHQLTGGALELPDGTVKVTVKAMIATFDSGNGNRDSHVQEVLEITHFPQVSVKAVVASAVPKTFPADVDGQAQLEITLHGVAQQQTIPVKMTFTDAGHVHATGAFDVSWKAFKFELPALLFVPIDDKGDIKFDLTFVAAHP